MSSHNRSQQKRTVSLFTLSFHSKVAVREEERRLCAEEEFTGKRRFRRGQCNEKGHPFGKLRSRKSEECTAAIHPVKPSIGWPLRAHLERAACEGELAVDKRILSPCISARAGALASIHRAVWLSIYLPTYLPAYCHYHYNDGERGTE